MNAPNGHIAAMGPVTARRVGGRRRVGRFAVLALCAGVVAAGCTRNSDRVFFDGVYFKSKVSATSEDRRSFVVRVPGVDRSIDGARAAGEYEGTRYCIENFGTSDIDWMMGPGGEVGNPVVEGNSMSLTGRCDLW